MTPERQQQVMAEALGWKKREHCPGYYMEDREGYVYTLPDWGNDLNAMHEAEGTLNETQQSDYARALFVCVREYHLSYPHIILTNELYAVAHATAAQRREAFIRAIGKWEE